MSKTRLEKEYIDKIRPALLKELKFADKADKGSKKLANVMQAPRLNKIVLNVGVKDAVADDKALQDAVHVLEKISGQKPVRCLAKKSIAAFKLREGLPIGVMVTLRGSAMYNFLDKLINLSLPKVRDFHGVSTKLDGRGGYNLGIRDWTIFPEIGFDITKKINGLNVTMVINAVNDDHARELLKKFKMPFKH